VEHSRLVDYSKTAKGAYLVINSNGREQTRLQVYCKEYEERLGLENLSEHCDPIDNDGKVVGSEASHSKRMAGDPELTDRDSTRPADRHRTNADEDDNYWHDEDIVERQVTRQMAQQRLRFQLMSEQRAQACYAEVNNSIQALLALQAFQLPKMPKTMEEALAGSDAKHWARARQ
jgi:hypothetical protein